MGWLDGIDWQKMFVPDTSLLEIFIRGTMVYLVMYTLLRVVLKRQKGGLGVNDLLVLVLIADAAQNAMAGTYSSITDGLLLVAVIIFWSAALDWLGYHVPAVQKFVQPAPLLIVDDGRMLKENMAKEYITEDELLSQLRLQGLQDLEKVDRVYIEGDGQVSILRKDGQRSQHHRRQAF